MVVVDNPQGQGDQEEQVGHGEIHHEDLYLIEFLGRVKADKHPQHVAIGDDSQHEDDAVSNWEEGVSELGVHTRGVICRHRSGLQAGAVYCVLPMPGRPHRNSG